MGGELPFAADVKTPFRTEEADIQQGIQAGCCTDVTKDEKGTCERADCELGVLAPADNWLDTL